MDSLHLVTEKRELNIFLRLQLILKPKRGWGHTYEKLVIFLTENVQRCCFKSSDEENDFFFSKTVPNDFPSSGPRPLLINSIK